MKSFDDFDSWARHGWERGWISVPICHTHDGIPTTEAEDESWEEGEDLCIHVVRLYENDLHRRAVERNSPAAVWRASNLGWRRGKREETSQ